MPDSTAVLEGQTAQRTAAKRATFRSLKEKKRQRDEFETTIGGEQVSFLFESVGGKKYDDLLTQCPPTPDQRAEGMDFNGDKFGALLLSHVCVDPKLTEEEWDSIRTDPEWGRAEFQQLVLRAQQLCNAILNIRPFGSASA